MFVLAFSILYSIVYVYYIRALLSAALETGNVLFEAPRWTKRQNGGREAH